MELRDYIVRHKAWSEKTFGTGKRTDSICKHIQSELSEILAAENDFSKLEEVVDVIILAIDMAWRLGFYSDEIEQALKDKQEKNFKRQWPPKEISEANQDKPTFHISHSPTQFE